MIYISIIFPVGKQNADITCNCNRIFSIPVPVLVNFVMGTRYLKMFGSVLSVPNIRYPTLGCVVPKVGHCEPKSPIAALPDGGLWIVLQ